MRQTFNVRRRAFTLVELLVVIAIIGILVALLIPAVQSARESARRMQCRNNLKQIALAMHGYHERSESFPSGAIFNLAVKESDPNWCQKGPSDGFTPWTVMLLPFLEEQNLHDKFEYGFHSAGRFMDKAWVTPAPNVTHLVPLPIYRCPSDTPGPDERNNYMGVQGGGWDYSCTATNNNGGFEKRMFYVNGVLYANSRVRVTDIADGSTNVFMLAETRYGDGKFTWLISGKTHNDAYPAQLTGARRPINYFPPDSSEPFAHKINQGFSSYHSGICLVAMADASVQSISETIDLQLYRTLAIRADGEPVAGFQP